MKNLSLAIFVGLFCLSAPVMAQAAEITITIKIGSNVDRTSQTKESNPWIDLDDSETALVSENGQIDTVRGPFHGRLKAARKSGGARLGFSNSLANINNHARAKIANGALAASKDPSDIQLPEGISIMDISIDTDEKQCFITAPTRLWRTKTNQDGEIILSNIGGAAQKLDFKKSEAFAKWPDTLTLTPNHDEYVVSYLGADGVTHRFNLVALELKNPNNITVARLVEKGCTLQAKIAAELNLKTPRP